MDSLAVRRVALAGLVVVVVAGVACDAGDPAVEGRQPPTPAVGARLSGARAVTAVDPWVRVAIRPEGSDVPGAPVNSAGYLVLRNPTREMDALMAVETEVADTAELHTVSLTDGVMRMRAVEAIPVAAGAEARLEPGGYHIMLIGIRRALEPGDTVPLTLRFRSGASLDVRAPVLRSPPRP